jgi:hypothetical protein
MTWTVHIHDGAAKQLKAIPPDRREHVLDDVAAFEVDPFRGLVKPLKGKEQQGSLPQGIGPVSHHFQTRLFDEHCGSTCRPSPQRKDLSVT